jgi:hypothetical protein
MTKIRKAGRNGTRQTHFNLLSCLSDLPTDTRRDVLRWLRFNRELGCLGHLPR